ncbi:homeobox protein CDX-2 [Gastrophryne carolinensis]
MYVSYMLDKDMAMYPVRGHPGFHPTYPQHPDYGCYNGMSPETTGPPSGPSPWISPYGPRDDWGPSAYANGHFNPSSTGPMGYSPSSDYPTTVHVQGPPVMGGVPAGHQPQGSPGDVEGPRRHHYDWMRKPPATQTTGGKTRTKDKYRVVYTDHQRLELEKEFHYSRYITIRRKSELAAGLGLSERQVKIWFQNRRAKERKITKKRLQQTQSGQHGQDGLSPVPSMGHLMPMPGTDVGSLTSPVSQ